MYSITNAEEIFLKVVLFHRKYFPRKVASVTIMGRQRLVVATGNRWRKLSFSPHIQWQILEKPSFYSSNIILVLQI